MIAGVAIKVTVESAFQALALLKLARKWLFLRRLKLIHQIFSETLVWQKFQPLRGT
jgi:hypothetical protein